MNIKEQFQQRFAAFSAAMDDSPNRDRVIYHCTHTALIFIAVLFVLAGLSLAVFPAIILSLVLSGRDAWQVHLSRLCSLAGLIVLGVYIIASLIALPFAGLTGSFAGLSSFFTLLVVLGSLILWFVSADRFYDAAFRLPPEENTGPW
ncbi:MAG: hypothetical protein GWP14_06465 [Actinobacteria bacterium]|nr:hypothetical protein [Actinomycetota bacterium]